MATKEHPVADLSVMIACHQIVVSIPIRRIERLVLQDEVAYPTRKNDAGSVPVVEVGATKAKYAAWNLGRMLEMSPLREAWVLIKVPHGGTDLALALNVGKCLQVGKISKVTSLPPGIFRERRGAFWGAFPIQGAVLNDSVCGLSLDPLRLWSATELEQSALALLSAHSQ